MTFNEPGTIKSMHDSTFIRALGRASYWQNLFDVGKVAYATEMAERERIRWSVSRAF